MGRARVLVMFIISGIMLLSGLSALSVQALPGALPLRPTLTPILRPTLTPSAPPRPEQPIVKHSAFVTVVQQSTPNIQVQRGGIVTYTIVATNRGKGAATNSIITMPFDPTEVSVVDARLSHGGAWVTQLRENALEFQTGHLESMGGAVTVTVRLATRSTVPDGTRLAERLSFLWHDEVGEGTGQSNYPLLVAGANDRSEPFTMLTVAPPNAVAGSIHVFASGSFAPNEPVSLWYNTPDGAVVSLPAVVADSEGRIHVTLTTTDFHPNTYSLVAYGSWTTLTAVGPFHVDSQIKRINVVQSRHGKQILQLN